MREKRTPLTLLFLASLTGSFWAAGGVGALPSAKAASTWFDMYAKDGHEARILRTGKELDQARLDAIRGARESIYLTSFIFTGHADQAAVYDALCDRARDDGIDVRLLVDGFGSEHGGSTLAKRASGDGISIEKLLGCGVKFVKFEAFGKVETLFVRHDKFLVVDGEEVILGGSNYSTDYSQHGRTEPKWYDMDIRVRGPIACFYQGVFADSWKEAYALESRRVRSRIVPRAFRHDEGRALRRRLERLDGLFALGSLKKGCAEKTFGTSRFAPFFNNPYSSGARPLLGAYVGMLGDLAVSKDPADKQLLLYAPYFVPDKRWARAVMGLARKGFDVHVITNSLDSIDKEAVVAYTGMLMAVGALLENGVKIHLWNPLNSPRRAEWPHEASNVFHKKGGVYGNRYAVFGSDNLDRRGQEYSSETIAVTDDAELVRQLRESYLEDLGWTVPLTKPELRRLLEKESLWSKFKAFVASPFI